MIIKNITSGDSAQLDAFLDEMSKVEGVVNITVSNITDLQRVQISSTTFSFSEDPLVISTEINLNGQTMSIEYLAPKEVWGDIPLPLTVEAKQKFSIFIDSALKNKNTFFKGVRYVRPDGYCNSLIGGYILDPIPTEELPTNLIELFDDIRSKIPRITDVTAHLIVDPARLANLEEGSFIIEVTISGIIPRPVDKPDYYLSSRPVGPSIYDNPEIYKEVVDFFQNEIDTKYSTFI